MFKYYRNINCIKKLIGIGVIRHFEAIFNLLFMTDYKYVIHFTLSVIFDSVLDVTNTFLEKNKKY